MFRRLIYNLSLGIPPQTMSTTLRLIPSVEIFLILLISPSIGQGYHWQVKCGGSRCWSKILILRSNLYRLRPKFSSLAMSRTLVPILNAQILLISLISPLGDEGYTLGKRI